MDGQIANNANIQYSKDVLGGAQDTANSIYPLIQSNITAAPDMAKVLGNYDKAVTGAAMMSAEPGTAYGYTVPQSTGLAGAMSAFAPSGINMAQEKPLNWLPGQAAQQQGLNTQMAQGQGVLAQGALNEANINNQISQSPINQQLANPQTSLVPYEVVGAELANAGKYFQQKSAAIDQTTTGAQRLNAMIGLNDEMNEAGLGAPSKLLYDKKAAERYNKAAEENGYSLNAALDPREAAQAAVTERNQAETRLRTYEAQQKFADNAMQQLEKIKTPMASSNFVKTLANTGMQVSADVLSKEIKDNKDLQKLGLNPNNISTFDAVSGNKAATKALLSAAINPITQQPAFSPQQIEGMTNADGTINNEAAKKAFGQYKDMLGENMARDRIAASDEFMDVYNNGMRSGGMGGAIPQDVINSKYKTYKNRLDQLRKDHPEQAKVYEQYGADSPDYYYNEIQKRLNSNKGNDNAK